MRLVLTTALVLVPAAVSAVSVCFSPNPPPLTVDCDQINPTEWPSGYVGFTTEGQPCTDCPPSPYCCSPISYGSFEYGWSLSASPTDPYENTGPLDAGTDSLFVFLSCNRWDGAAAAGFSFVTDDSSLVITAFMPESNVINAGTDTDPLLAIGGCPSGPALIGALVVHYSPTPVEPSTWGSVKALYR